MAEGWYGFNLDLALARQCVDALSQTAEQQDRPAGLGRLELSITPIGTLSRGVVDGYEQLGVDRLVLLPQPDADRDQRHRPVPVDRILRNIDWVAERIIGP
jgi:hypothetical protein